ncbi:putative Reticulan like protein B13 [Tripterygium wilfordii]|uniref:Reticulon-like protein n=1 Tax=Tripterygium wilfordii TaxID=458696 RepID=A0A7J7CW85_TRIWF|nr:reticulon-like protein B13 [Tripterygium wilfordii]KAF5738199.1 putative Reticulan like protein B13 [Tripterygium wilfordii]
MSATSQPQSANISEIARDIYLWRSKKLSVTVLTVATAIWVLLDVYEFNFITVASWLSMFIVSSLFLYANLLRLLGKQPPDLSGLEITEEQAVVMANSCREMMEEFVRWMFRVSAEGDWFEFAKTVAGLLLLSYVASCCDLLTLLYIGIVTCMTIPVMYAKNEEKIKRCRDWIMAELRWFYEMIDNKVIKNIKNRMSVVKETKHKKVQ